LLRGRRRALAWSTAAARYCRGSRPTRPRGHRPAAARQAAPLHHSARGTAAPAHPSRPPLVCSSLIQALLELSSHPGLGAGSVGQSKSNASGAFRRHPVSGNSIHRVQDFLASGPAGLTTMCLMWSRGWKRRKFGYFCLSTGWVWRGGAAAGRGAAGGAHGRRTEGCGRRQARTARRCRVR
jgi:hypothetical protein